MLLLIFAGTAGWFFLGYEFGSKACVFAVVQA